MITSEVCYSVSGAIRHLGLPVAGVTVTLFEYWRLNTGMLRQRLDQQTTGPRGEFTFSVSAGTYYIEVTPDASTRFLRETISQLSVASNTICNINLKTGSTLSGRVVTKYGAALTDCRIVVMGLEPPYYRTSDRVDSQSAFTLVLPKGRYFLIARHECDQDQRSRIFRKEPFIYCRFDDIEIEQDRSHDIVLPDLVALIGKVTTDDGAPASGVRASLTPAITDDNLALVDLRVKSTFLTDEDGHFEVLAEPGTYDLVLQSADSPVLVEHRERSISIAGITERNFSLAKGFRLSGRVVAQKKALRGCIVKATGPAGKAAVAVTGADGEFALALPEGAFDVTVGGQPGSADKEANSVVAPWVRSVSVPAESELIIDLPSGVKVSGVVTDSSSKPRPGVPVSACLDRGRLPSPQDLQDLVATTVSGSDGNYALALLPGNYWILLNEDLSNRHHVEVKDEAVDIDLVWSAGCVVRFNVVSDADAPIARCRVLFEPYAQSGIQQGGQAAGATARITGFAITGDDGISQIALGSGIYSFRFQPPSYSCYQTKVIRQLSVGGDLERTIRLSSKEGRNAIGSDTEPAEHGSGNAGQLRLEMTQADGRPDL